ncbi:MAG: ATP-binding protein, partial [Kofleriaceae bacterium]
MVSTPIDLSQCDREPVHIPGVIQPHGLFFVLDPEGLTILCASENTECLIGIAAADLVGRSIASIASLVDGTALAAALREDDLEQYNPRALRFSSASAAFEAIAHRHDGRLILECEPAVDESLDASHFYNRVRASLIRIRATKDLDALCAATASEIRQLTGFDRVLIYRFRPDLTGEVVAESADEQHYLGLRFPASDIPSQARALYAACRLRMMPTARYVPARLVGAHDTRPIDMTHAVLRSVSPVHLQYMANMGVTGSMGISLMDEDRLWGLVTCNHESGERFLPYRVRMSTGLIGEVVSSLIGQKERIASSDRRVTFLGTHAKLTQFVTQDRDVVRGLTEHVPSLADVTSSPGAALYYKGEVRTVGATPPAAEILALITWLEARDQQTVVCESLPASYPPAHVWKEVGCGLVASRITLDHRIAGAGNVWLLWFRPEIVQIVTWGGDPNKSISTGPLHPRTSFEAWREDVHLLSPPFSTSELEAARAFTGTMFEVILEIEARRQIEHGATLLAEANRRLVLQIEETQRAELELRRAQKLEAVGRLASGLAHEINTPVQYVSDSVAFLKEAFSDLVALVPPAAGQSNDEIDLAFLVESIPSAIERSLEGLGRVATLVRALKEFSHADRAAKEPADLNQALANTIDIARGEVRNIATVSLDPGPLPQVPCFLGDLNQVFLNLIVNAAHAIQDSLNDRRTSGTISIRTWQEGDEVCVAVADDGAGIPEAIREQIFDPFFTTKEVGRGSGQGLALARAIVVGRHGGSLTFESEVGRGTTFT